MSARPTHGRLAFFRQQAWQVAVFSLLLHHKDGLAWGLCNLATAFAIVFIASVALSYVRKS